MNKQIKSMDQLKDSRLLYEKKVPQFGYIIVIISLTLLIGVVIWSLYTPKVYMIKTTGIVTNENAGYVMPVYTGEIVNNYMFEGKIVEQGDVLFTVKSTDYDLQEQQLKNNSIIYKNKLAQSNKLVKSIKDDKNYFDQTNPDDALYYSTYETYKSQVEQNKVDVSTYKNYGYTDKQIEDQMLINQNKISEIYYTAIKTAESTIDECKTQIASIDAQISAISSGQSAYSVKANSSGVLHLLADYKSGMVVQTASAVATITPENDKTIIEASVSTADMARMHKGDKVEMAVSGLTQTVYGTISGTVKQIDSNVSSTEDENGKSTTAFKVKISPDYSYLTSKSGEKINIINGMTVEARIEYDKVTYFNYVLEKLGFLVR